MTKQVQRRRGTSTQHTSFTGAEGEISVNTTNKSVHVHDGVTAGGFEAARADLANVSDANLNNALSGNTLASLTITSADINGGTIDGATIGGTTPAAATFASATVNGNITVTGTVDGRDLSADGSKLDGIEAGADVTDTANVTAAGALMDSELTNIAAVKALNQGVSTTDSPTFAGATVSGDLTIADKIVHSGDTNTSIRFPAADTVTVETSGTERLRIDSAGTVGIGTSSPSSYGKMVVQTDGGTGVAIAGYSPSTTNGARLVLSDNYNSVEVRSVPVAATLASDMVFRTNGAERLRIDASGNLLVGTTSGSWHQFSKAGTYSVGIDNQTTNNNVLLIAGTSGSNAQNKVVFANGGTAVGTIYTTASTTAYNTSSDYRLKENVQPMQNALDTVARLNPVTYTWKADGSTGQGFIAHELQAVVPDCVTGEKDAVDEDGNPQYQGVDTSFLVATLVKAIQELKAEVDSLRAQLNP